MLGIIFAVLAVDDREMDFRRTLAISVARRSHRDRGVDDRLEPGEVVERAFRDGVMSVCDAVMHRC